MKSMPGKLLISMIKSRRKGKTGSVSKANFKSYD